MICTCTSGECLDQGICACYPGFKGADCSVDCGCGSHGRCAENGTSCICDVGWRLGASGKCEWDCGGCPAGTSCIGPGECGYTEQCVYGTCFHGACRCWAGYGGPACNLTEVAAAAAGYDYVPRLNSRSLAGANLPGTSYYSTEWMWIDLMKSSSIWMTANADDTSLENKWDTGVPLELRPDGYPARLPPGTVAHKLFQRNMLLHAWPGRYVVLYDGDGRLDFKFDARVTSRAKGRVEFIFNPTANLDCAATGAAYCGDNGIHLVLTATNPANPLRNIRILPSGEGAAATAGGAGAGGAWESRAERAPFHPWFLKSIARYRVLRFMGWLDINNDVAWAAVASSGGIALEYLVRLCNLLGTDPWVNVHHLADDDYVTSLATMLRDSLRPDVKVYVEHSNEVWNQLFPQGKFARARGLALNLSTDATTAGYRYHALRTAQIATIFRNVFSSAEGGGAAGASRVKVVMGGWGYLCGVNGSGCGTVVLNQTLGWLAGLAQKVNESTVLQEQLKVNISLAKPDFYGITAYWDCGLGQNGAVDVTLTVEQMIAKCNTTLNASDAAAKALVAAAAPYGIPLITYEAGPSIVEASAIESGRMTTGLAPKYAAVNRHPAMYGLYKAYLDTFVRAGLVAEGRPFMQFVTTGTFTQYGSWGLQEYTGQPVLEAPKYRALMDWLDMQPTNSSQVNISQVNISASSTLRRPLCMSLPALGVSGSGGGGGMGLGEGLLAGPPAVYWPAAGGVAVLGTTERIRWSTVGWAAGVVPAAFEITLWYESDCEVFSPTNSTTQLAVQRKNSSQAVAVLPRPTVPGALDVQVPRPAEDPKVWYWVTVAMAANERAGRRVPRFFLRFSDGLTTNYSEPFDMTPGVQYVVGNWSECECSIAAGSVSTQRRNVSCGALPGLEAVVDSMLLASAAANATAAAAAATRPAPPAPQPFCDAFPNWNLSRSTIDPSCTIDAITGCRTYRTNNTGGWAYSMFKPVTDCTAQASPWPLPPPAAVGGFGGSGNNTTALAQTNASMLSPPGQTLTTKTYNLSLCAALLAAVPPAANRSCNCTSASSSPRPSPTASPSGAPPSPSPPPPPPAVPYCSRASTNASLTLLNAGAATCSISSSDADQCGSDSVCTAVPGCKRYVCDTVVQALVQVACTALCQPRTLGVTGAQISDDGRAVVVRLTAVPAPLTLVPCTAVFEAASGALLGGGGALCSTGTAGSASSEDNVLVVKLAANATLLAGQTLTLLTRGSVLVGAINTSRVFTGSAQLSGPLTLSRTACESATGSLLPTSVLRSASTWDASNSGDPSGRANWAGVTWTLVSPYVAPGAGTATRAVAALMGAVERANGKGKMSDRLTLTLTSTEVEALEEGITYSIMVTVTSWLGTSASANASFSVVASSPTPLVAIAGPALQTARISSGLRLSADVVGGGCKGRSLSWNWTCPSGCPAGLSLPDSGRSGQQLVLPRPLGLTHGQNVSLRVTASYGGGASGSADVVVVAAGSPPLAVLKGPAGDVLDNTTLVLNATSSSDPDVPSSKSTETLQRSDHPTPCFTSTEQGDQLTQPGVWSIPPGLLSTDIWHTITVTVYKQVQSGASPLNATASVTLRPRAAGSGSAFPRGSLTRQCAAAACAAPHSTDRNLTVLLQLASPYDTTAAAAAITVAWDSPEAAAVSELTAVTSSAADSSGGGGGGGGLPAGAFLLTIPAALLPAARSSITITANITLAATGATGTAAVTVPLNSAPYCTSSSSDPGQCLSLTVLNDTFPTAAFTIRASGWADVGQVDGSSQQLKYEFGVRRPVVLGGGSGITVNLVQQLGTATSATLVGLPQGAVQLYGCAIDVDGSRTCGLVNVTVSPPGDGFNATAALASVNVTDLLQTDIQTAAMTRLTQLLQSGDRMGNALGLQAVPRESYLAAGDNGVYVSAAALPTTAATTSTGAAAVISVQLRAGPDAVAASASATGSGGAASGSSRRRRVLSATAAAADGGIVDVVQEDGEILLSVETADADVISGSSRTADGHHYHDYHNSRWRRRLFSTANDTNVEAQMVLSGSAAAAAAGYGIDLQYAPSSEATLVTALSSSLPAYISILSGLVTVTWNEGAAAAAATSSPPSLDGTTSYLTLAIPAPAYNPPNPMACLSYDVTTNGVSGSLGGLLSAGNVTASAAVYDSSTGRLSCNVTAVGTYFVAQAAAEVTVMLVNPEAVASVPAAKGNGGGGRNVGVLVGGVIGGVVGLVLVAAAVVAVALAVARKRKRARVAAGGAAAASNGSPVRTASRSNSGSKSAAVPEVADTAATAADVAPSQRQAVAEGWLVEEQRPRQRRVSAGFGALSSSSDSSRRVVPSDGSGGGGGGGWGNDGGCTAGRSLGNASTRANAVLSRQESAQGAANNGLASGLKTVYRRLSEFVILRVSGFVI
ncbi:hypothetical protein VOLCADRAFT_95837 [Volvox carteri f. nagariensis]|uniref:EGF-like domain-containing protein n=1 Tax=Volvox carteri f. nagariensis TaxID=3068 RepID=D8U8I2_VOLCA|nr:uncharacterized protein VOLCADRAFT_95837 [Volvox carteri f. nagariensis]EFJ43984.1 hypothetical protein VOLCADRAFT_95837 [Volvox carteri f. nagariensis]|eukprot:XP_002954996.1 hypothetical protein VOLCADRAFT_95837 [Volvox carteri f. nagariensis]